jgi:geranylgeranyl pyrophosphate synthase/GT2 family glycosyltransferase
VLQNSKTAPEVSVVLSVHNGGQQLRDCLASLARNREHFAELLVVDDGSTDDAIDDALELGARVLRVASRRGPANGRNVGAMAASGDILLFLDADVCVHDDAIPRIRQRFAQDEDLGALFGSYDTDPAAPQLVSQFRNLLHCFVHQTSNQRASTFWSGCGAIRREIFLESKGFDVSYSVACIEDIELGSRLVREGIRIALDPLIQVRHLKRWTLWAMIDTDIRRRGICWTRLILLSHRMPNDLNLRHSSRVSVALTGLFCVLGVVLGGGALAGGMDGLLWRQTTILPLLLVSITALNLPFYRFLAARRGHRFAAAAVPLHLIYFFCCGTAFGLGLAIHCFSQLAKKNSPMSRPDHTNIDLITLSGALSAHSIPHTAAGSVTGMRSGTGRRISPAGRPLADGDFGQVIESALLAAIPQCPADSGGSLNDALRYALFPGGKRLRPRLTMLGARIFGTLDDRALRAACAVEFVHASSLIFDDLPCMDDADLRRGNPTLHRVFGEEVALLTGIALLNQAYALFAETPELIREAAECIGVGGMIGGQAIDLCLGNGVGSLAERDRKTSALMRLALTAGALAVGASREDVAPLAAAGQQLGQAYQICDDLLDAGLPGHSTGKTPGQDLRHHRPSHSARLDENARHAEAMGLIDNARRSLLEGFGSSNEVAGLTSFIDAIFAPLSNALQPAAHGEIVAAASAANGNNAGKG